MSGNPGLGGQASEWVVVCISIPNFGFRVGTGVGEGHTQQKDAGNVAATPVFLRLPSSFQSLRTFSFLPNLVGGAEEFSFEQCYEVEDLKPAGCIMRTQFAQIMYLLPLGL